MITGLLSVLNYLLFVAQCVIIVQFVLSLLLVFNVINSSNDFVRSLVYALDRITEPLYRPIRRILPDFGGIDFSPMVVLIIIQCLRILITNIMYSPGMM